MSIIIFLLWVSYSTKIGYLNHYIVTIHSAHTQYYFSQNNLHISFVCWQCTSPNVTSMEKTLVTTSLQCKNLMTENISTQMNDDEGRLESQWYSGTAWPVNSLYISNDIVRMCNCKEEEKTKNISCFSSYIGKLLSHEYNMPVCML